MTKITYVNFDGTRQTVDVADGSSVMEAGRLAGINAMDGDCGGCCACATCKVVVSHGWLDKIGVAGTDEREMLEFRGEMPENARLSCQIKVDPELDGLVVYLPKTQDSGEFPSLGVDSPQ
jgi:2Fe-2S ferredoxin